MAKPPRRKVPTPNTNTTGEAYVDDTELEDGADNVEDTITEGFSEDTAEDGAVVPAEEDSEKQRLVLPLTTPLWKKWTWKKTKTQRPKLVFTL